VSGGNAMKLYKEKIFVLFIIGLFIVISLVPIIKGTNNHTYSKTPNFTNRVLMEEKSDIKPLIITLNRISGLDYVSRFFKKSTIAKENQNMNFINPTIKEGWPQTINQTPSINWIGLLDPVISDLDNDGKSEIIIYAGGSPTKIYIFKENGEFFDGWPVSVEQVDLPGGNIRAPSIKDIDNDTFKEILVNGNDYLYVYNYKGSLIRTIDLGGRADSPNAFVVLFDLNNDGLCEIIAKSDIIYNGTWWTKLVVCNHLGDILPGWPQLYYNHEGTRIGTTIDPSASIGNFDDDPEMEIVVADQRNISDSENSYLGSRIHVYNIDATILQGFPTDIDGIIFSSPSVGDVNSDGYDEIIIATSYVDELSYSSGLYVIDRHGKILPHWPQLPKEIMLSSPALSDLNQDGYLEIVQGVGYAFGNFIPYTYIFDYNGNICDGWPQKKAWYDAHSALIGDITEDNVPDIITSTDKIYAWDSSGKPIEGFPFIWDNHYIWCLTMADIDNDGMIELIGSDFEWGQNGSVCVWELRKKINLSTMHWTMIQHDPSYSGHYDFTNRNNHPPNNPQIQGPESGTVKMSYEFNITSTDPENDTITYIVQWGDGAVDNYRGYQSGKEAIVKHSWRKKGTFSIKVKARDSKYADSNWTYLEINMPKNNLIDTPLQYFLKNHPILFPLLHKLIVLQSN